MRPHLSDIKDIPLVLEALFEGHNLREESPFGGVALCDVIEEISRGIVRVVSLKLVSLLQGEVLNAGTSLEVKLDPELISLLVDPLEGMRAVAIHVTVTVGCAAVAEEDGDLVAGLRRE